MTEKKERIYIKGEEKTKDVKSYNHTNTHCVVEFKNGKTYTYNNSNVIIEKETNCVILEYLQEIADLLPNNQEKNDDSEPSKTTNFLSSQLKSIDKLRLSPVLKDYFTGTITHKLTTYNNIIYPFGGNLSQFKAIRNALSNEISIIEGPPGTGKTQTILNIIANVLKNGKNIAIVSGNNSATENVAEKLASTGYGDIVALLGNMSNRARYFESKQHSTTTQYTGKSQDKEFNDNTKQLESLFELDNEISKLDKEIYQLNFQKQTFIESREISKSSEYDTLFTNIQFNSEHWLLLRDCCEAWREQDKYADAGMIKAKWSDITICITTFLRFRINIYSKNTGFVSGLSDYASLQFYATKYKELLEKRDDLKTKTSQLKPLLKQQIEMSKLIFDNALGKTISRENLELTATNYKEKFDEFIKQVPVILSTTNSIRNSIHPDFVFDYLIIDESSQVDLITATIALSCCKQLVVVGDDKQLPHIVKKELKNQISKITLKVDAKYDYVENSILDSLKMMTPKIPTTTLREHYRCHPLIIDFCNHRFYNSELIIKKDWSGDNPFKIYTTDRKITQCQTYTNGHIANKEQHNKVVAIINDLVEDKTNDISVDDSIGVIAPYRNFVNDLQKDIPSIVVDTVHKFQGREMANIIVSTVSDDVEEKNDFINDPRLVNVAVSRAVRELNLVCGYTIFDNADTETNIGALICYMKANGGAITFHSIFDYLYDKNLSRRRQIFLQKNYGSNVPSENLINELLCTDLLKERADIDYLVNYPLRFIVGKDIQFTEKEQAFLSRSSHIDFLLYNTLDKSPRLAIEVNGQKHKKAIQQRRDEIKSGILDKCNIRLLSLDTCGSNERQLIIDALNLRNKPT